MDRRYFGMSIVLAICVALSLGGARSIAQGQGKKSKYRTPQKTTLKSAGELERAAGFDATAVIDTNKKPDPMSDLGVVIVSGSDIGGIGGFYLKKGGGGVATVQFYWNGKSYTFGATLEGYGSTANSWVYVVKDVKIENKKMYFAFPINVSGDDQFLVWASNGVDDPKDGSSFSYFGTGMRGERPRP